MNEAAWVEARTNYLGQVVPENTILTEGRSARRLFGFFDTAVCSERALRVEGPPGSTVSRVPRYALAGSIFRCEFGTCDSSRYEVVDVEVNWTPTLPGPTSVQLSNIKFDLEVARDLTSLESIAIVPKACRFVGRVASDLFVCDQFIFNRSGAQLADLGILQAVDVEESRWLAVARDGGGVAVFAWDGGVEQLAKFDPGPIAARPVLFGSEVVFVSDAGLNRIDYTRGTSLVEQQAREAVVVTRSRNQLLWFESVGGEEYRACRYAHDGGVLCETLVGRPAGTDRGLWFEERRNDDFVSLTLLRPGVGDEFSTVRGPFIDHRAVRLSLGFSGPFRAVLHPGLWATHSMCAFREIDKQAATLGVAVYPEGELDLLLPFVSNDGNGYEGLRWCVGGRLDKTFVYSVEE